MFNEKHYVQHVKKFSSKELKYHETALKSNNPHTWGIQKLQNKKYRKFWLKDVECPPKVLWEIAWFLINNGNPGTNYFR